MEREKHSNLTLVILKFKSSQRVDFYHWVSGLEKWVLDRSGMVTGIYVDNAEEGVEFHLRDLPTSHDEVEIYITSGEYHYVVILERADIESIDFNDIPIWDKKEKKIFLDQFLSNFSIEWSL